MNTTLTIIAFIAAAIFIVFWPTKQNDDSDEEVEYWKKQIEKQSKKYRSRHKKFKQNGDFPIED